MDVGSFVLGAVVAGVIAKVLWDKEKAKHYAALNALREDNEATQEAPVKQEADVEKAAPAKKAPEKKKSAPAKKKASTASKAKKTPSNDDVEGKIKTAVANLKASGEKVSLAAVSRESGISYSRIKRQKELVEKYK